MNGEVDTPRGKGLFNFFSEHAFGADLGQGNVGDLVASGMNNFNFDFVAARTQKRRDVVGLPESKLGAAGADAEFRSLVRGMIHIERFVGFGGRAAVSRLELLTVSVSYSSKKRITIRKFPSPYSVAPMGTGSFEFVWRFVSLLARLRSG